MVTRVAHISETLDKWSVPFGPVVAVAQEVLALAGLTWQLGRTLVLRDMNELRLCRIPLKIFLYGLANAFFWRIWGANQSFLSHAIRKSDLLEIRRLGGVTHAINGVHLVAVNGRLEALIWEGRVRTDRDSWLCDALLEGKADLARSLVQDYRFDVNYPRNDQQPLHLVGNDIALCKLLLDAGADFRLSNCYGKTPLQVALEKGHQEVARLFMARLSKDERHNIPFEAYEHGNANALRTLTQIGIDLNVRDIEGRTFAQIAAADGKLNVLEMLATLDADLSVLDDGGRSLLHIACRNGRENVARWLIGNGFDPMKKDPKGYDAPMHAIACGHLKLTDYFVEKNYLPRSRGGVSGSVSIWDMARERFGWDFLGERCRHMQKYVFVALEHRQAEVFHALLEVTISEPHRHWNFENGDTFLHALARHGVWEATANCEGMQVHLDNDGKTPAIIAIENGRVEFLSGLLTRGLDTKGLLECAVECSQVECVQELCKFGQVRTTLNDKIDDAGRTILFFAIEKGDPDVVRALLEAGADPTVMTEKGESPMDFALNRRTVGGGGKEFVGPAQPQMVSLLFEFLPEWNCVSSIHDRALTEGLVRGAIVTDNVEELQSRANAGADLNQRKFLLFAIGHGANNCLQNLLERDAIKERLEEENARGETVLFASVRNINLRAVEMLLAAGADRNKRNSEGERPAAVASGLLKHPSVGRHLRETLEKIMALLDEAGAPA